MRCAAGRGRDRDAGDADDDHEHREVLAPARVLAEHPLRGEDQHDQARRQRWLHDDQRSKQQRDHLQWEAEDRHPGAEQPARAPQQPPGKREAQVLVLGGLLGLGRLIGNP
jgi:hypothetical protein